MIGLLFIAAAATAPMPGELKTFSDWTVGCDNGRACQANALQGEEDYEALTMVVSRGSEPNAPVEIGINSDQLRPAALAADGKRIAVRLVRGEGQTRIVSDDAPAFIAAIRPASRLALLDAGGREIGHVLLSGANAALLYMDDRQRRVGTVTALVRPGPKPASTVPPPPALPIIASPPVPKLAPRKLTAADLARILKPLECEASREPGDFTPVHARLDAKTTLALVPHPCGNGAYNYFAFAMLVDQAGKVRDAAFDAPGGMGPDTDNTLVNADWDAQRRLLTTYSKGRGLGDCGSIQEFAWDGARFRLVKLEQMGECRGSVDYITTWRAARR